MTGIDLKSELDLGQLNPIDPKGVAHAHREAGLRPDDGLPAAAAVPQVRRALSRHLQGEELLMSRPVPLHGLRPAHLPRESARHRGMPAIHTLEAVSHGHTEHRLTEHARPCQRDPRLAYLRRLRPDPDPCSPEALCGRRVRRGAGRDSVCPRLHHDRPLSVPLPLGPVQATQGSRQAPHASRPARPDPFIYTHYGRSGTRRQHPRRDHPGAWRLLRHGPRLSRLLPAPHAPSLPRLLRHQGEEEVPLPPSLLPASGEIRRAAVRSDRRADRVLSLQILPGETPPNLLLRCDDRQQARVPHEQLHPAGAHHRPALQVPLADRDLLQVDQATPAHQELLRHLSQRGEGPDLDRHLRLRAGGHPEEEAQPDPGSLHNLADPERHPLRETASVAGTCGI